jgi:sec-independent protein translocase protein TatB
MISATSLPPEQSAEETDQQADQQAAATAPAPVETHAVPPKDGPLP